MAIFNSVENSPVLNDLFMIAAINGKSSFEGNYINHVGTRLSLHDVLEHYNIVFFTLSMVARLKSLNFTFVIGRVSISVLIVSTKFDLNIITKGTGETCIII